MRVSALPLSIFLVMVALACACNNEKPTTAKLPTHTPPPLPSVMPPLSLVRATPLYAEQTPSGFSFSSPTPASPSTLLTMLFTETDSTGAAETAPYIIRSRFVKLNLELLIGENGGPRALKEISANLFPDVVYTCIIRHVENNAGSYSWVGSLKGVENSEFVMVYTAGVFMGHFASPEGVYEVSNAGDDIYRVIMIDQQKLQDHGE